MSADGEVDETLDLIARLERGDGTLAEAEQWLARLKAIDPYFNSSDYMHGLETAVKARRVLEQLTADMGEQLTRDQMVDLVRRLSRAEGTAEEQDAWLELLERNVPHPEISNLIYWPDKEMSPEEVVDRALAHKPIILGPATRERDG